MCALFEKYIVLNATIMHRKLKKCFYYAQEIEEIIHCCIVWFDVNISLTLKFDELLVTLRKKQNLMPFDWGWLFLWRIGCPQQKRALKQNLCPISVRFEERLAQFTLFQWGSRMSATCFQQIWPNSVEISHAINTFDRFQSDFEDISCIFATNMSKFDQN